MDSNIINNKKNDEDSESGKLATEGLDKDLFFLNFINIKKKSFKYYIFLLIFLLMLLINYLLLVKYNRKKYLKQIISIEKYYKICNNGILINKKTFTKLKNPDISIIATAYSKEKYISRFLRSIQNQNFDSIEIIIIDDFSDDNSIKNIKTLQKEDYRIKLIKNKNNKGTLISRNEGILLSRGKYIMTPDIDDIISHNIINQCFVKAEKNNYDMIKFNTYLGNNKIYLYDIKYLT